MSAGLPEPAGRTGATLQFTPEASLSWCLPRRYLQGQNCLIGVLQGDDVIRKGKFKVLGILQATFSMEKLPRNFVEVEKTKLRHAVQKL